MSEEKRDWLNTFVEKNFWGLVVAFVGAIIGYTGLKTTVSAHDVRLDRLESGFEKVAENQTAIVILQQQMLTLQQAQPTCQ